MRLRLLVGLALVMVSGSAAFGQAADLTTVGSDRRLSTSPADEFVPVIAWNDTADQYLVVWEDHRSEANRGADIYGRRVGSDGMPIGTDFRISASIADEVTPAVAWNATAGEYLVVWQDDRNPARLLEIVGRRVSAAGVPLGTDFRVSTSLKNEYTPAITWNATDNQYLVVWSDSRSHATRGFEIYGRRVGAGGALLGAADFRISTALTDEDASAVVWNAVDNQYLVVWVDERSYATRGSEIFGRRVSAGGLVTGVDFRISNSKSYEDYPTVAWSGRSNQYLVVWEDFRSAGLGSVDIFGRAVTAGGAVLGTDVRISPSVDVEYYPAITWNAQADQYLVVWEDDRNLATRGWEVYGRRVGVDGVPIGGGVLLSTSTSDEHFPAVAWNGGASEYLVVWEDHRSDAVRGEEIYSRRVTADA